MKLSNLAENMVGSEIVKLGNAISERIKQGEKIYNYTIGDFNPSVFPIPAALEALIVAAYQDKNTNYPPADGIAELRNSVAAFVQKHQGVTYSNQEILIAAGGRPLIYTLFKVIVNTEDKVIYATPSWNNNHYVHMNHGLHCVIETSPENNFMPTAADIAPHIQGAALLCLCTPQNPTGTTLGKEELAKICDLVIAENERRGEHEKKLYVMFDQMYGTLTYGDTQHSCPVSINPAMKAYTVYIDGISKSFAATGVRVGWSMGPTHVIAKMKALLSHVGAWAPMAEQVATAAYLQNEAAIATHFTHFKAELEERLQRIYNGIVALRQKGYAVDAIAPQAAIYLTIKFDLVGSTDGTNLLTKQADVTTYLLNEAKLAVVPFYAFGASHQSPWYRLSVGTCVKEEIDEMLIKLEAALAKLSKV